MSKRDKSTDWRRLPSGLEPTQLLQFWEAAVFRRAWDDLGKDNLSVDEKAAARAHITRQKVLYSQRKQRRSPPPTSK